MGFRGSALDVVVVGVVVDELNVRDGRSTVRPVGKIDDRLGIRHSDCCVWPYLLDMNNALQ